jgi:hypothetical protein
MLSVGAIRTKNVKNMLLCAPAARRARTQAGAAHTGGRICALAQRTLSPCAAAPHAAPRAPRPAARRRHTSRMRARMRTRAAVQSCGLLLRIIFSHAFAAAVALALAPPRRSYIMLDATVGALGFYLLGYGFAYGDSLGCARARRGAAARIVDFQRSRSQRSGRQRAAGRRTARVCFCVCVRWR